MKIAPYLSFDGQCAEAFTFYESVLKTKIEFKMTYGESPMAEKMGPDSKHRIMRIAIRAGGFELLGADAPKGMYSKPQGLTISISVDTETEAERIFSALSQGGKVMMPIQETFWAKRFGMAVDRFGIPWMVGCHKPM
jgi:PhnB protein